jgi:hypothetical protein
MEGGGRALSARTAIIAQSAGKSRAAAKPARLKLFFLANLSRGGSQAGFSVV